MNHRDLHREKVLAKRKVQQGRRKERQKNNRKNVMTEQHRINYYLAKQLSHPVDDRDLELIKYYREKNAIEKRKEEKKKSLAQRCIGCSHNNNGWCNQKRQWCNEATTYCLK